MQDAIEGTRDGMAQIVAGLVVGVGRQSDHRPDLGRSRGIHQIADMADESAGRLGILDHTVTQRRLQGDMDPVLQRLFTKENIGIAGNDPVDDAILSPCPRRSGRSYRAGYRRNRPIP